MLHFFVSAVYQRVGYGLCACLNENSARGDDFERIISKSDVVCASPARLDGGISKGRLGHVFACPDGGISKGRMGHVFACLDGGISKGEMGHVFACLDGGITKGEMGHVFACIRSR